MRLKLEPSSNRPNLKYSKGGVALDKGFNQAQVREGLTGQLYFQIDPSGSTAEHILQEPSSLTQSAKPPHTWLLYTTTSHTGHTH